MFGLIPYERSTKHLDQLFENFLQDGFFSNFSTEMKIDIRENDGAYLVEAEIPGVQKEAININYTDEMLTISVERQTTVDESKEKFLFRERKTGQLSRSFYVRGIDAEAISAKYEDGVLKVVLPKVSDSKRQRKIEIQ